MKNNSATNNNQWNQYLNNSHIEHQLNTEKFRCKTCNKELKGKTAAARHSTAMHSLTIDGEQTLSRPAKLPQIEAETDLLSDIINENNTKSPNFEQAVSNFVMENINRDIARGATRLAQNIDLRFLYERTKSMFPPDWTFEDWICNLVEYSLASFGVKITVSQNKEVLSPMQKGFADIVKADWMEFLRLKSA